MELTLPDYGCPVLFSDTHNTTLRSKYDWPAYLVGNCAAFQSQAPSFTEQPLATLDRQQQMQFYDECRLKQDSTPLRAFSDMYN